MYVILVNHHDNIIRYIFIFVSDEDFETQKNDVTSKLSHGGWKIQIYVYWIQKH